MHWVRNVKFFLAPPPGALGRGQKVKYHLFSITKSISKIFTPNCVCVLTNERYKTYQTGFLFCRLGHALGVGLWGTKGPKSNSVLLSCPLCYLLLNHWTKFNQIWCVSYSHELGAQRKIFFGPAPWGPGEGSKSQISFNFNYKVNFKDFYSKLCVCSHK